MSAERLRRYIDLHGWLGVVSGLLLFVAFYTGAINMFQPQLQYWQTPAANHGSGAFAAVGKGNDESAPANLSTLLQDVVDRRPAARRRLFLFPQADPAVMWQEKDAAGQRGDWVTARASEFNQQGDYRAHVHSNLARFVAQLHRQLGLAGLGLPVNPGMTFMGFVALLYGAVLLSGLFVYLCKLLSRRVAEAKRDSVRRYWVKMHTWIGVPSLPFHLIMAATGAVLGGVSLLAMLFASSVSAPPSTSALDQAVRMQPVVSGEGQAVTMAPLADYLESARVQLPGLAVDWVEIQQYGDAGGRINVAGSVPGLGGHHAQVVMTPSRQPTKVIRPGNRRLGEAALSATWTLHGGYYGGVAVKWLYAFLGLLGALLVVSGNVLWCERRTDQRGPDETATFLLRLTLGVCFGVVAGLAVSFLVAKGLPYTPWRSVLPWLERIVFWATLVVLVALALRASPLRFSERLLTVMPALYLAIPLLQLALEGSHAWQASNLLINAVMWVIAAGLWLVKRIFRKRLRKMPPHTLWVGDGRLDISSRRA